MYKLNLIFILIAFLAISCNTVKPTVVLKEGKDYMVAYPLIAGEKGTIQISEFRYFKIRSSMDAMVMMFKNYGKWDEKLSGKYQENIEQVVWKNVKLLDDDRLFTVVADGTETETAFFASLVVYDQENKNCFDEEHPLREELIPLFLLKLFQLSFEEQDYKLFNGQSNSILFK
jgi:hypothetical protein